MGILITHLKTSAPLGGISVKPDGSMAPVAQAIPDGITGRDMKPCIVPWLRRLITVGQFSQNLIRTENKQIVRLGMLPPTTTPTIAPWTSTGGSEGVHVGWQTFRHKINGQIVHESNPGPPSNVLELAGQGRVWTNLQTSDPNGRATHSVLYLKLDEAVAREVVEFPIGADTISENVPALSWGRQISFRRGVPPWCQFAHPYHNRMWYSGDPLRPDYLWYSELNEPESVALDAFIPTKDRDAVTAIGSPNEDQLVAFTFRQMYDVQGYRGSEFGVNADLNMRYVDRSIGCVSHHSLVNIGNRMVFAAEKGIAMFDGAPRYVSMHKLQNFWNTLFKANPTAFARSWGVDDEVENVYKLFVEQALPTQTFYFILNYEDINPTVGTPQLGEPRFGTDRRARKDSAARMMPVSEGSMLRKLYTGSCDGIIREENVEDDLDDNGDTYGNPFIVQPGHSYFEEVGGDRNHGKTFVALGLLMTNELSPGTCKLWPGGDRASDGLPPTVRGTKPIPVSAFPGRVAKDDYFFRPYLTGQGLSIRLEIPGGSGAEFAGWYGEWVAGGTYRPLA